MAWKSIDRNKPIEKTSEQPLLSEALRAKIRGFFDRYETKKAAMLPALQMAQSALGHVPPQAVVEIAEVLEVHPSEVVDTMTFYTHFWDHPKGAKVIMVCRSISCEVLGGGKVLQAIKDHLGIDEHETTEDGKYSLMTEECLAGCDHGPCMLIGEKLHQCVKPEDIPSILADDRNDVIDAPRSDLFDPPGE